MTRLSRPARVYVLAVTLAGPLVLLAMVPAGGLPLRSDLVAPGSVLAPLLIALAALALHFPLELGPRSRVHVAVAVHFAILWLFGLPVAVALVGASELLGGCTLALRRDPRTGRRLRGARDTLFNAGQMMLATALAGSAALLVAPQALPIQASGPRLAPAMVVAAVVMYLVNTWAVSAIVALQRNLPPARLWLGNCRQDAPPFAGLYLVGAVAALTAPVHPWSLALLAAPTAMLYLALKRQIEVIAQTIAAVEAMADAVDVRDPSTDQHSRRVAVYAERLARAMQLSEDRVEAIRRAARVHDLGKVAVPDAVLFKPGPLSGEEWELMKQHAEIGYQILAQFREYREVRDLVRLHHERADGQGYPLGLAGEQIPLGAQVISICDTLDALTSDRCYHQGWPLAQALAEIRRQRGAQFLPAVVDALERLVAESPGQALLVTAASAAA